MASAEDRKIIEQAQRHFKVCAEAEHDLREKALDDLRFLAGEQWTARALAQRSRDQRPALVVNRLDQFVQHITNAMRQNRVSARVFPVDDAGDVDTAEVIQGVIRHIENDSKATLAYNTGAFYAVAIGWGYWRLITEYCDPLSFDLDIRVERGDNPFQYYLGPHNMPDGSDASYGFKFTDMTRDEFERTYPDADATSANDWSSLGDKSGEWLKKDEIRVAEYYRINYEDGTLVKLADGSAKLQSKLVEGDVPALGEDGEIIQRETQIPTVVWYKLNALEILDKTTWPIPKIPIVKVTGTELTVDGKLELKGIVRNMKDAQRQYNVMLSAQTEAIDSSKGQVVMFGGQEEGHEEEWRNINRQQVLRVNATDAEGKVLPLPQRLSPNMSIQAMNEARLMAADDLKALTGIYDSALGARSNETSGKGILARQNQSETANYHFEDNLTVSITHSTRMMVDLIGKVYDTPRVVRIVGEDDSQKVVKINQQFNQDGENKFFNLKVGQYDVVCDAGPSFKTKRREGAQILPQVLQAIPMLGQVAPDLIIKTLDIPYAQEIADRALRAVPPGIVQQKGQPKIPPQVAQQLSQMGQQIDLLTKELNARTEQMERKQFETESSERIKKMDVDSRERIAMATIDSNEAIAALKAEIDALKVQVSTSIQAMAQGAKQAAQTM